MGNVKKYIPNKTIGGLNDKLVFKIYSETNIEVSLKL